MAHIPMLVIIRGLPGSGKSTLARSLSGPHTVHVEADQYFTMRDGTYSFKPEFLKEAHEWCQNETARWLANGYSVVVSNTFTRRWEYSPYLAIAGQYKVPVQVIECHGNWPNTHGVPAETIARMRDRWEPQNGHENP